LLGGEGRFCDLHATAIYTPKTEKKREKRKEKKRENRGKKKKEKKK